MKFMAVSQNTRDVSDLVPAETERINQLTEAGTLSDVWVKADYSGAFLVLEGADEAEVRPPWSRCRSRQPTRPRSP